MPSNAAGAASSRGSSCAGAARATATVVTGAFREAQPAATTVKMPAGTTTRTTSAASGASSRETIAAIVARLGSPVPAPEQIDAVVAAVADRPLEHEPALEPVLDVSLARVLVGPGLEVLLVREEQVVREPR